MAKLLTRQRLAYIFYYSGTVHLAALLGKAFGRDKPLFLTGHRVLSDDAWQHPENNADITALKSGHAITTYELDKRIRFLKFIRPKGDPSILDRGLPDSRDFYLTFDDGYKDNLTHASRVLSEHGTKAIIFLIGSLLGRRDVSPWWDAWGTPDHLDITSQDAISTYNQRCKQMKEAFLGLLNHDDSCSSVSPDEYLYISDETAEKFDKDSIFYIANHTMSHPNLRCLTIKNLEFEIGNCIDMLSEIPSYLPLLAYPFGTYNQQTISYLKSRGDIRIAFTTGNGTDENEYSVRRINLNTQPFPLFAAECVGLFTVLKNIKRHLPFLQKNIINYDNEA